MKLLTKIEVVVFVVLIAAVSFLFRMNGKIKAENERHRENVENLTKQHEQELTLTRAEFDKSETWWKYKIDSLTKANKIRPKEVKSATIIQTQYIDTGSVRIVYKTPVIAPENAYLIPVSYSDSCWGMEGVIKTKDPESKFDLTERTSKNSAQLLVTRKRVLGFLWWSKKQSFKAYTDCGTIDFVKIEFTK